MIKPPPEPELWDRPAPGKVLVLAPHPDDETMGMAGTIRLHRLQNDPVCVVFVCSGVQGDPEGYLSGQDLEQVRKQEARAAARILGLDDLRFWGYPDNLSLADFGQVFEDLPDDPEEQRQALVRGLAARIATLLDEEEFDLVYHPWEQELNPDHWAAGQAVEVLKDTRKDLLERVSFLGYDVWSPLVAETVVDISDVMPTKLEAVNCYRSQLLYRNYVPAILGLDAYRSLHLQPGATFGEGFRGHYRRAGGQLP